MAVVLAADGLDALLDALVERGYRIVGPTVSGGAIVHGELASAADLPAGWTDEQAPGSYRLARRGDDALFGYAVGPQSWKAELFPARVRLWRAQRENGGFTVDDAPQEVVPTAFVGVRPCELAAIAVHDRVFLGDAHVDTDYAARRADVFIVAVECGDPSDLCFCADMGTGPGVEGGFDVCLTELLEPEHRFLLRTGSTAGEDLASALPAVSATPDDEARRDLLVESAARRITGRFDPTDLHGVLTRNLDAAHWEDVAERCLSCANCTLVCPTCFCTTVEDVSALDGSAAERTRVWDTCFSLQYAEMHGGNTRPSPKARYRQWLTHKLATWHDQFGTSGCVGCGRCIAWCPVGIDIREEVRAIRAEEDAHAHA